MGLRKSEKRNTESRLVEKEGFIGVASINVEEVQDIFWELLTIVYLTGKVDYEK